MALLNSSTGILVFDILKEEWWILESRHEGVNGHIYYLVSHNHTNAFHVIDIHDSTQSRHSPYDRDSVKTTCGLQIKC